MGRLLPARVLKEHSEVDKHAETAETLHRAQERVKHVHEGILAEAARARLMQLQAAGKPLPVDAIPATKYRKDRVEKIIGHISDIKDEVAVIHDRATRLLALTPSSSSDDDVLANIQELRQFANRHLELKRRLQCLERTDASTKYLFDSTATEEQGCSGTVRAARKIWDNELEKRTAAKDIEYSSGSYNCICC